MTLSLDHGCGSSTYHQPLSSYELGLAKDHSIRMSKERTSNFKTALLQIDCALAIMFLCCEHQGSC